MALLSQEPIEYHPGVEQVDDDEADVLQGLLDTFRSISEKTLQDYGQGVRAVHAKSHGVIVGELQVHQGLPPELAQGLFAQAAAYPVVMRLSTIPGDILDDRVSLPRGVAIKVVGVPGERLEGSEGQATQDFLMVNGPVFGKAKPRDFLKNLKVVAATTDKAPGLKQGLSTVLQGVEKALEAVGGESATLKTLGGHPQTHILGETFFSQLPLRYGRHVAKLSLVPVSATLVDLKDQPLGAFEAAGTSNPIRDAVVDHFDRHGAQWELRVQLCTNLETMPIEDGSVQWPEEESPFVTVATLTAGEQNAWSAERIAAVDQGMAFSPWHGLAAHRPLGGLQRVRRASYEMSARFRAQANARPMREPETLDDLPG
ncbi:MAG: catalase [Rubrivivax sp.]|nr:MAG: catalase [Rubrivivax sp.]